MEEAPPTPRRAPLFYGWVIVAVMAVVGALTMALGTLNFGLFIKPMGDDLGIGRAIFGWAQSIRQVASAVTAPLVGSLIDRFGARVLLTAAALVTGAALVCLGFISDGWQLLLLFGLMGIVGMSGPGALVTTVPVIKWFVRQRGKALSFMSLGIPLGGLLLLPLTQILIDAFGWRTAWIILAIGGAGLIIPLALIFVRRQPEDMGLLPDGEPAPPAPAAREDRGHHVPQPPMPHDERSWTRAEAVRSATFWRLVVVFSLVMLATSSMGVHRIASFMDSGLDARVISYATALDAAAAGLSTFAMGLLTRWVPARFIGAGGFLLLALATILTIIADSYTVMFAAMITYGLGIGVLMLMQNYLWADYFGRQHQGSIRGAVMPITLIFGATGAPVAGYVRDLTGSYGPIWLVGAGLLVIGAAVLAITPSPQAPTSARAPAEGGPPRVADEPSSSP